MTSFKHFHIEPLTKPMRPKFWKWLPLILLKWNSLLVRCGTFTTSPFNDWFFSSRDWWKVVCFLRIFANTWKAVHARIWKNTAEKVLENLIHLFFVEYLKQFPDENLKPKAHFLQHYPQMIEPWSSSKNTEAWSQTQLL